MAAQWPASLTAVPTPDFPARIGRVGVSVSGALAASMALVLCLGLSGCGSTLKGRLSGRDGPAADIPPNLERVPDAEPRIEPIRAGGPNKPYEVLGQNYQPETRDVPLREVGLASWYGRKFHGRRTASGEAYDMHAMTAAHKTMPLPSYARVRNLSNGREVIVRVNDRGPFASGRVIDLSYTAALKLDLLRGVGRVEVERITFDDIRTGAWRRGAPPSPGDGADTALAAVAASPPRGPVGSQVMPATPAAPPAAPAFTASPTASTARNDDGSPLPGLAGEPGDPIRAVPRTDEASTAEPPGSDPVATAPAPSRAEPDASSAASRRGFWVQLGAFRERAGAQDFQQRVAAELGWLAPLMSVFSEAPLWRLQAGPYASRDEAQGAAQRVRDALQLVPVIVEKR